MIEPFKSRKVDPNKPVDLYRCLNRKGFTFSVRQNGVVVGHTNDVILKDCSLVVNEAGKHRCLSSNTRNVHAYVQGTIGTKEDIKFKFSYILRYNPFDILGFHILDNESVTKCKTVYLEEDQIYCQL